MNRRSPRLLPPTRECRAAADGCHRAITPERDSTARYSTPCSLPPRSGGKDGSYNTPGASSAPTPERERRRCTTITTLLIWEQEAAGWHDVTVEHVDQHRPARQPIPNEWAKPQAAWAGIGHRELSNGFAAWDNPAGLQAICDRVQAGTIEVFA